MLLKESECVHADFMQHFFSMFAALFNWEAGHHGNSMCAVSVQGTPLLSSPKDICSCGMWLDKKMQIVPTELPIVINRRLVT